MASLLGLLGFTAHAQMSVLQDKQPTALVKEVLLGRGILVDNVHYLGMPIALGEFRNPSAQPFFSSGIVLSTGAATQIVGPNDNPKTSNVNGSPGDKNLAPLAGGRTFDGAKLEFDFKADRDSVTFNFIFASEEYHDYVGSTFNDVFALVVSGSTYGNGKNLAVVPGTTIPITVNSVNPNQNRQYYFENNPFTLVGRINEATKASLNPTILANFEYDGMTKVMAVGFRVTPKQVYHFEIVVSDAGDGTVDSAVLLEGGSFKSLEQYKHVLRREQIAAQRRQDSLVHIQVVADSLARLQSIADSIDKARATQWESPGLDAFPPADSAHKGTAPESNTKVKEVPMETLRRNNQSRLDSMARADHGHANGMNLDSLHSALALQKQVQRQQDSIHELQGKLLQAQAEKRHEDSLAQARKTATPPEKTVPASNPVLTSPPPGEIKETIQFEASSYFVPASAEQRLQDLGKLLHQQADFRLGIYLPQGEPNDVLNMRYDMIRFELLKAGAKSDQIFRNGFSFSAPSEAKNAQRAELWMRKE